MDAEVQLLLSLALRPLRPQRDQAQRLIADHVASAERRVAQANARIEEHSRRVAELIERSRAAGTGVVPYELTLLEREVRKLWRDAERTNEEELDRLWRSVATPATRTNSLDALLVFASDPEGIRSVEAQADSLRAIMADWRSRIGRTTLWRVTRELHFEITLSDLFAAPLAAAEQALRDEGLAHRAHQRAFRLRRLFHARRQPSIPMRCGSIFRQLGDAIFCRSLWDAAVENALRIPDGFPPAPVRFADLPHPIRPALEILRAGYSLSSVTHRELVIEALPLDPDPWR